MTQGKSSAGGIAALGCAVSMNLVGVANADEVRRCVGAPAASRNVAVASVARSSRELCCGVENIYGGNTIGVQFAAQQVDLAPQCDGREEITRFAQACGPGPRI